jgi:membrane associated rhomboid family serine protease
MNSTPHTASPKTPPRFHPVVWIQPTLESYNDADSLLPQSPEEPVTHWALTHPDGTKIREWSLTLHSQEIEHSTFKDEQGWHILVPPKFALRAETCLRKYVEENNTNPLQFAPLFLSPIPLITLFLPTFFFFWSNLKSLWQVKLNGAASASEILGGEWWRLFTAQTLHADLNHYMSNMASGYFILNLLFHRVRAGLSSFLLLMAAAAANYFVALTHQNEFRSLGYSTFVFAALGALSLTEVRFIRKTSWDTHPLRRFQPLYAAFFLAVMLGLGENADVLAHFYGFAAGALMGIILPLKEKGALPRKHFPENVLGFAGYFLTALFCWSLTGVL